VVNTDKTKKEMDKSISVKVSTELLEKAREKSANTGIALSFIVRKAIEDWVKENASTTNGSGS
jgi:predicted DNA-binding protein